MTEERLLDLTTTLKLISAMKNYNNKIDFNNLTPFQTAVQESFETLCQAVHTEYTAEEVEEGWSAIAQGFIKGKCRVNALKQK